MPHYLIEHTLNDGYAEFVGAAYTETWVVTPDLPTVADALAWSEDQDVLDPYADRITCIKEVRPGHGTPGLLAYLADGKDPRDLLWVGEATPPYWAAPVGEAFDYENIG